jgi:tRNA A58 N-methylase Trm61
MFASVTGAFIPALLDAARIATGHRVLDVAKETGAAAKAAADLVGPTGEIIAGDRSSTMLDVAIRNPEKQLGTAMAPTQRTDIALSGGTQLVATRR